MRILLQSWSCRFWDIDWWTSGSDFFFSRYMVFWSWTLHIYSLLSWHDFTHSITVSSLCPLGLCKSLMSIQLFQMFCTKGRVTSNELPKALTFCVFSCGKDKRLKTLWHWPWAFAGYCNPFMVSWISFKSLIVFFFSFLFLDELTEHFLKQSWHIIMYTCYRI